MTQQPSSLDTLAVPAPEIPENEVLDLLIREYGLQGKLTPLVSERDQNFRLDTTQGRQFVVKIANVAEPAQITDFQIQALLHLEASACTVAVPKLVRTSAGEVSSNITTADTSNVLRVVSYLPGRPVEETVPGPELAYALGQCLADLDRALGDFSHAGESQVLLWDMQRASELRDLMAHVSDPELQAMVNTCLDDFEERAAPQLPELRSQVIHNDLNPGNILITDTEPATVAGVIDFGDMLRAPLIIDVAIAAAYLRSTDDDTLAATQALIAGFDSIVPLEDRECQLLFDLIRMRLATTITILYWRKSARSEEDAYLKKALREQSSERFLRHINGMSRQGFADRVLNFSKTN
jgi:Ser/Thr protein kinase RdoA (MazF antagonist)